MNASLYPESSTHAPRLLLAISLTVLVLVGLALLLVSAGPALADGNIIYVNHAAAGGNDGSTWDDAYITLQAALDTAADGDEIWVATGVYTPTNAADRTATFQMVPGVAIYGGFAATETLRTERDWAANVTVLSGDLGGDDTTDANGVVTDTAHISGTNAYHVVVSSGVTETAVLDGFTVTAGQADGSTDPLNHGGGLYNNGGTPTLSHVTFSGNQASEGGGMYNTNGSPLLTGALFVSNSTSGYGGGLYNLNGSPLLTDVAFRGNSTTGAWSYGGGMSNHNGSPVLTNVLFSGNDASVAGAMYNASGSPFLNGVTMSANRAVIGGGLHGGGGRLVNCIVWGNSPDALSAGAMTVSYSIIQGGYLGTGNLDADPLFVAPVDASLAPSPDGNYRLRYASPAIDAGNTLSVTLATDLDGNPRVVGDDVDMGAYEFQAYTLTVVQVGEGQVIKMPDQMAYTYLDQVVLTATAEIGWTFVGWSGDVVTTTNPLTLTIMGHTAITATFSQDEYALEVSLVGDGAVSKDPDQPTYWYGDVVTLTATAEPGWTFVGWSGDVVATTNPLTLTILGHTAITATFTQDEYTLEVSIIGDGAVNKDPDQPTYHYGSRIK